VLGGLVLSACEPTVPPPMAGALAAATYAPLSFGFPVAERDRIQATIVGVDHDPTVYGTDLASQATCTDYDDRGFPHCYDEHAGSDFLLDGGFPAMDDGSATVVAAAAGRVIATVDGYYDRCHVAADGVSCDGHEMVANEVELLHEGGITTRYLHLMSDSIRVEVGQQVDCGEALGLIGSSGRSSMPHVHFEVRESGERLDPFAGPNSQPRSWWQEPPSDDDALPGGGCAAP